MDGFFENFSEENWFQILKNIDPSLVKWQNSKILKNACDLYAQAKSVVKVILYNCPQELSYTTAFKK